MAQTVISDLPYRETVGLLEREFTALPDWGTFFAIVSTEYAPDGTVAHDLFEVIEYAVQVGYRYVNTIVYPTASGQRATFYDNARYVVWLCKNAGEMQLDKDAIREKHIWKDVEWGKRAKNYNPKGKDPGNVWIPTLDDGQANITDHILLDDEGVIARLLALAGCGEDHLIVRGRRQPCPAVGTAPPHPERRARPVAGKVYFKTAEDMGEVEDGTVSVVVTSPPYWDLKDYFKAGQIGQEEYPVYLERMRTVWQQCYQKLTARGSLWININIRTREGKVIDLPRDLVKLCREIGFWYRGIFLWHKSSGIPTGERNIVDRHEYVLVFFKGESFALDPEEQAACRDYKNEAMNGGTFWNINRKAGSVGRKYIHPAIYPNELAARIIRLASAEGETVLDPFLGSGTSLIAALGEGRSFVGYEYNEGFRDLMVSRFARELPGNREIELLPPGGAEEPGR